MTPALSVIIPTHERPDILAECLAHLERQSVAGEIEAIVIHDGQDAKTDARVANSSWQIPVHYESIPKSQQGVARNRGVVHARASTCLFLGDDMFLKPDACAHHIAAHANARTPSAVLGFITWDDAVGITPDMTWL